jgi:hypothetical protein
MPLAEANNQKQSSYSFWMPLAKVNHQTQLGHPSRMPLAEANHQSVKHFVLLISGSVATQFLLSISGSERHGFCYRFLNRQ